MKKRAKSRKFKKIPAPTTPRKIEDERILMLRSWHHKVIGAWSAVKRRKAKAVS
jgi:hypothetical protein